MQKNEKIVSRPLTSKDQQLLGLLQENARMSVSAMANRLGLSRTTVQSRLQKLEQTGVIDGYRVKLADALLAQRIRAHVCITVEPSMAEALITQLKTAPEVVTLYSLSGRMDYLAMVEADSTQRLDEVLDLIGELPGVRSTESSILLKTKFDRR